MLRGGYDSRGTAEADVGTLERLVQILDAAAHTGHEVRHRLSTPGSMSLLEMARLPPAEVG